MEDDHWTLNAISQEEDDRVTAEENAKSETQVLREALALLSLAHTRLVLRVQALEATVKRLEIVT